MLPGTPKKPGWRKIVRSEIEQKAEPRTVADDAEAVGTQKRCPECKSTKLVRVYERAELVCAECGFVVHDKIMDMGPEWRAFDREQREHRNRAGAPMTWTIHDKGLSTTIDWQNRDSRGRDIPPKRRVQLYRLRKWQQRARVSGGIERNLALALSEIDRMSSHLGLPRKVRETAAMTYRRAVEEKLIRGRSIESVVAAALYAACRECKIPRTLDEIASVSRIRKKEIGRTYRFIARELSIHLRPTSPADYIPRFGSELGLSGETQSKAIELLKDAADKGLTSGRGPIGVAAAAIYIASVLCGERRTQRNVADVAQITEVTVRNRYKNMCEKLRLKIEP